MTVNVFLNEESEWQQNRNRPRFSIPLHYWVSSEFGVPLVRACAIARTLKATEIVSLGYEKRATWVDPRGRFRSPCQGLVTD